jgi:hypothetical protein
MLLEADRLGASVPPTPVPTAAPTALPTATSTPTPTPTATMSPTSTPTPTPTPTSVPGNWTLEGIVKVGDKKIALAKVSLTINGQVLITYSDSNGAFSFRNVVGSASYTVTVRSAGYTFSNATGTLLSDISLNIVGIAKNYVLQAKVTDKDGQPSEGVIITDAILGTRTTSNTGLVEFSVPYGTYFELNFLNPTLSGQIVGDVTLAFVVLP